MLDDEDALLMALKQRRGKHETRWTIFNETESDEGHQPDGADSGPSSVPQSRRLQQSALGALRTNAASEYLQRVRTTGSPFPIPLPEVIKDLHDLHGLSLVGSGLSWRRICK